MKWEIERERERAKGMKTERERRSLCGKRAKFNEDDDSIKRCAGANSMKKDTLYKSCLLLPLSWATANASDALRLFLPTKCIQFHACYGNGIGKMIHSRVYSPLNKSFDCGIIKHNLYTPTNAISHKVDVTFAERSMPIVFGSKTLVVL